MKKSSGRFFGNAKIQISAFLGTKSGKSRKGGIVSPKTKKLLTTQTSQKISQSYKFRASPDKLEILVGKISFVTAISKTLAPQPQFFKPLFPKVREFENTSVRHIPKLAQTRIRTSLLIGNSPSNSK